MVKKKIPGFVTKNTDVIQNIHFWCHKQNVPTGAKMSRFVGWSHIRNVM